MPLAVTSGLKSAGRRSLPADGSDCHYFTPLHKYRRDLHLLVDLHVWREVHQDRPLGDRRLVGRSFECNHPADGVKSRACSDADQHPEACPHPVKRRKAICRDHRHPSERYRSGGCPEGGGEAGRAKFDVVVTSTQRRAFETARILVGTTASRSSGASSVMSASFGVMEGLTWDDIQSLEPPILMISVGNDLHTVNPKGGEPFEAVWERAKEFRRFSLRNTPAEVSWLFPTESSCRCSMACFGAELYRVAGQLSGQPRAGPFPFLRCGRLHGGEYP